MDQKMIEIGPKMGKIEPENLSENKLKMNPKLGAKWARNGLKNGQSWPQKLARK
jgi:hypothetical protein